jgi:proteasome lid subunit RPN8/RPN11
MIVLNAEWSAAIRAEGERAYPNKCCGVLLGVMDDGGKKQVSGIVPIENAHEMEE